MLWDTCIRARQIWAEGVQWEQPVWVLFQLSSYAELAAEAYFSFPQVKIEISL